MITIISASYNSEKTIERTLESVLNLNYPNLTYIIIDGKSNDNTINIISNYEDKFKTKNILLKWISESDQGIYDAMNKGWAMADINSYILFVGCDDIVLNLPSVFNSDIIYGNVLLGDNLFISKINFKLKLNNTIHHQGLFIKKRIHPSPPFNIKYKMYADFDFNQRLILLHPEQFTNINQTICYADPTGYSHQGNKNEMVGIVYKNHGLIYAIFDYLYLSYHELKNILDLKINIKLSRFL